MNLQEYLQTYTLYIYSRETIHDELQRLIVESQKVRGRKNYDAAHTEEVVNCMEALIQLNHSKLNLVNNKCFITDPSFIPINPIILLISAYAHDWGYTEIEITSFDSMKAAKPEHMKKGAVKISSLLHLQKSSYEERLNRDMSMLTKLGHQFPVKDSIRYLGPFWFLKGNDWIRQITDLVLIHDDFTKLTNDSSSLEFWHQRILIMADTLGMLKPMPGSKENFGNSNNEKAFLEGLIEYRLPLFLDQFPEAISEFERILIYRLASIESNMDLENLK